MLVTTNNLQGNLLFAKISTKLSNFDFAGSASVLKYNSVTTQQYGLQAGISFPGKLNLHLKSQLDCMFDNTSNRLIYTQSVSLLLSKNLWTEGSITFGNLKNYADLNGLYVFNADDPTIFKSGLSLIWSVAPNISLVGNYTYNQKNIEPSTRVKNSTNYNQHSLSGGIIWKL